MAIELQELSMSGIQSGDACAPKQSLVIWPFDLPVAGFKMVKVSGSLWRRSFIGVNATGQTEGGDDLISKMVP